jgi:hypothetical protein
VSLIFFASHAHLDRDKDLRDFVRLLRDAVRAQTGALVKPEEVGFFDETHIETGDDWEKVLSEALSRAKICVCLYSPTYRASRYCGKEYGVFLWRRQKFLNRPGNEAKRARVVFPILWVRPPGRLPPVVAQFQYTDAKLPEEYEKKGLRYLAKRPGKAAFRKIIEELGIEIRDALVETELPADDAPPRFEDIPSAFHDAAYGFRLAVLHPEGSGWMPYPGGGSLRTIAETVAAELKVSWRDLGASELVDAVKKAERDREAVLVVCEAAAIGVDLARTALVDQLTREGMRNFALLCVWPTNAGSAAERASTLETALPGIVERTARAAAPHDLVALDGLRPLEDRVEQAFEQLRHTLVAADPALKAEHRAMRDDARNAGVPVERPSLCGPGARP